MPESEQSVKHRRVSYVGDSTSSEIQHALALGKNIRWLEPEHKADYFRKYMQTQAVLAPAPGEAEGETK